MNFLPRISAVTLCALCAASFSDVPALVAATGDTLNFSQRIATGSEKKSPSKSSSSKSASGKSASSKKSSSKKSSSKGGGDEKKVLTGGEWSDPDKLQARLETKISRGFKTWDKTEVDQFLKEDWARSDLACWELIRAMRKDEEAFKEFRASGLTKSTTRRFLAEFVDDESWIEGYLYTAPPDNAVFAIKLLRAFAGKDDELKKTTMLKKIATGVAGEFSRRGWFNDEFEKDPELSRKNGPTRIWRRYKFFADSWREKRLNVLFDKLDYWDMRIVAGTTGRTNTNAFGHEDSLRWGQDNVKLPEASYASPRDIFQMPYRLWSKVGDSVQTNDYYRPFLDWYNFVQLKTAQEVGCVCGGVSHFGATAACANGIPAVTMGEPGHCAFAVRVKGVWRPNNSVSWEHGVHWRLWDEKNWQFLHLTQALYSDKKPTMLSFRIAVLAHIAESQKNADPARVLSLYEYALEKQPLNFPIWREYLTYAAKQKQGKDFWKNAHKKIIDAFVPALPDVACITLGKYVYPQLLPLTEKDDEKIALFADFWGKTDGNGGTGRWDCESVWAYEVDTLGDDAGPKNYNAFRKNYKAAEPKAPGSTPPKERYKEKIGAIIGKNKDYGDKFEKWKAGTRRK